MAAARRPARGPTSSVSSRSWTSARHGKPAWVISAATSAPEDSAASSRASRPASAEAASAARCRSASAAGSRRSAGSSSGKRAASVAVTGWSRSQPAVSSPVSSAWSTNGDRRRIACESRRSVQRSTRTPASSSAGYQRVVSSQTQRTGDAVSRSRTWSASPSGGSGGDLGRRSVVVEFAGLDRAVATAQQEDAVHACSVAEHLRQAAAQRPSTRRRQPVCQVRAVRGR